MNCGFVDLEKREDGHYECTRCGHVMPEHFIEMAKHALPAKVFKTLGERVHPIATDKA